MNKHFLKFLTIPLILCTLAGCSSQIGRAGSSPAGLPVSDRCAQNVQKEQEQREYPNGTPDDYQSLLVLRELDYSNMSIADFDRRLLQWADGDYERMERVNCDVAYHDFTVPLTEEEIHFVSLTTELSGIENAKYIQSIYTGRAEEMPFYSQYLPQKLDESNGGAAWCELGYNFSWQIADKEVLTVGERDRCLEGLMKDIRKFWEETDINVLLKTSKAEIAEKLQNFAGLYSTEQLKVTIAENDVFFECMDERFLDLTDADYGNAYEKVLTYKTEDYAQQSVADFNRALDSAYPEFSESYEIVLTALSPDDENYDFIMLTLSAAINELYYENVEKSPIFYMDSYVKKEARPVQPLPGEEWILEEEPIYNFGFYGQYYICYTVPDRSALTVAERDYVIKTIRAEMQKYVDGLSETELMDSEIRARLAKKADKLAKNVSSDRIKVSCEIEDIEIFCTDTVTAQ